MNEENVEEKCNVTTIYLIFKLLSFCCNYQDEIILDMLVSVTRLK